MVPQDPTLFQGTVRENLCLVEADDDATIWAALERAHAADIVRGPAALTDAAQGRTLPSSRPLVFDEQDGSHTCPSHRTILRKSPRLRQHSLYHPPPPVRGRHPRMSASVRCVFVVL
jgi:hypothetical protein